MADSQTKQAAGFTGSDDQSMRAFLAYPWVWIIMAAGLAVKLALLLSGSVSFNGDEAVPLFGPYPQLSETPGSYDRPAPGLGDHNEEIYRGIMGFSKEELARLRDEGII